MVMRIATNFSAGPGALPSVVIQRFAAGLENYQQRGYSILEASHRGALYIDLQQEVQERFFHLLDIPADYTMIFLGGGATLQFALFPYNFATADMPGCYLVTGAWGAKAYESAKICGCGIMGYDGSAHSYTQLPAWHEITDVSQYAYLHITSNETINGLQWRQWPQNVGAPLVADMSSDILSRSFPITRFDGIYASAQKNLGIAGLTVVIVSPRLMAQAKTDLPPYYSYRIHADSKSRYNTPPVVGVYMLKFILEWITEKGGLAAIEERNREKAARLYDTIDAHADIYTNAIAPEYRSYMNVIFTLPTSALTAQFIAEAEKRDIIGINGHRSIGGCRISLYNAIDIHGVDIVTDFMRHFAQQV